MKNELIPQPPTRSEYDVVVAESLGDLIKEVNAQMAEGWTPLGGMTVVVPDSLPVKFYQSMYKEAK